MKVFSLIALSFAFILLDRSNFAFATTIVAVVTSKNVIIATDSRLINMPPQKGQNRFEEVSKIVKSNNFYFAVAGMVQNSRKTFNLNVSLDKYFKQNSFHEAIKKIKADIGQILNEEFKYISQNRPEVLKEMQKYSNNMASFIVVGIQKGIPFATVIQFKIINGSVTPSESSIHSKPNENYQTAVIGQSGGVEKVFAATKPKDIKMTPEQWAEYLIEKQIEETPKMVSLPIDIVRISSQSVDWIKRKKSCPLQFE